MYNVHTEENNAHYYIYIHIQKAIALEIQGVSAKSPDSAMALKIVMYCRSEYCDFLPDKGINLMRWEQALLEIKQCSQSHLATNSRRSYLSLDFHGDRTYFQGKNMIIF